MFILLFFASLTAIVCGWLMYWKHPILTLSRREKTAVRVSVIVPARDEEHNLPRLLESLQEQRMQPLEIIVADDGSTDKTRETAERYGAKVIAVQKQSGWKGKTAGCFQGAQAASGDWLLFMDADTWLADDKALETLVEAYHQQGSSGLLSLQPYHVIKRAYENGSVLFNVLVMAGMNIVSAFNRNTETDGAFGPVLLCSSTDYWLTGGHEAAKEALIEGFALGRTFKQQNLPIRLYNGQGVVHFRMYPQGLKQLMDGWTKHFATGSKGTHLVVMTWIAGWIAGGFIVPVFAVFASIGQNAFWTVTGLLTYLVYGVQFFIIARKTGTFSWWLAAIYPVAFLFFIAVFTRSWMATNVFRSVRWKGQKIDL